MLSKDTIKDLRVKLQTEYEQHIANANAAKGALQFCDLVLSLPDDSEKCSSEDCPTA